MLGVVRLGIIGCGDVLSRSYAEGLRTVRPDAQVVACCDSSDDRVTAAARLCTTSSGVPTTYRRHEELLDDPSVEAVINLTPAPLHFAVTRDALSSGRHVYSEKPLAHTLEEADGLIALARERKRLLLCAPATMATSRFRWISGILASGCLGRPVLAVGQLATLGPAAWRRYTGDPRVFYSAAVGPVTDLGVYLLHAATGLLGRVVRVQSMERLAIPDRTILAGPRAGTRFRTGGVDVASLLLEFANGASAQLLCGFAMPASRAPVLEVHCTGGTVTLSDPFSANGPVDAWLHHESPPGIEGWVAHANAAVPPSPVEDLIACGPVHFVRCLLGEEAPVLTAEHARHALEIKLRAHDAALSGTAQRVETSLDAMARPETGARA